MLDPMNADQNARKENNSKHEDDNIPLKHVGPKIEVESSKFSVNGKRLYNQAVHSGSPNSRRTDPSSAWGQASNGREERIADEQEEKHSGGPMISPPLAPVLCDEMYGATSGKEDSKAEIENDNNDSCNLASPISAIRHSDGFDEFESPDSIDLEDEHPSDRRNIHNYENKVKASKRLYADDMPPFIVKQDASDREFSPRSVQRLHAHEAEERIMGIQDKKTVGPHDLSYQAGDGDSDRRMRDTERNTSLQEEPSAQGELHALRSRNKLLEDKLFQASVEAARAENKIRLLETSLDQKQSMLQELSCEDYELRHFEANKQKQRAQEVLIKTQFFAQELFVSIRLAKEEAELSWSELQENLHRIQRNCEEKDIMFKHYLGKYKELSAKWKEQQENQKLNDNQGQTIWHLRSRVQELERQLASEVDSHLKLKSMFKSREREMVELKKRNARLANEMEEQRNHREISLIENEELRREIARVLDSEQRMSFDNENLKSQIAVVEKQCEDLRKENEELKHVNSLCSKSASATSHDLTKLKKELEASRVQLKERDSELLTSRADMKLLKLRVKQLEDHSSKLSHQQESEVIKSVASVEVSHSSFKNQKPEQEADGALTVRGTEATSMELAMKNWKEAYLDTSFPFFLNFVRESSERLAIVKQMTLEMEASCDRLTYELNSTKFKSSRLERRLMETERSRHELTMMMHERSSQLDSPASLTANLRLSRLDRQQNRSDDSRGHEHNDLHLLQELRDTKVQLVELEAFMSILEEEKNSAKAELAVTHRMLMSVSGSLSASHLPSLAMGDASSALWNNIKDLERLFKEAQRFFEHHKETTFFKEMAEMKKSISFHALPQRPSPSLQPPQEPLATTSAPLLKSFQRGSTRRSGAERDAAEKRGEPPSFFSAATLLKSPRTLAHRQQLKAQSQESSTLSNASQRVREIQRLLGR